eukprot:TRINITY_DN19726_c0_g1_i1.p1 TRINITY_DN19726_c0_g1~~TRINITY_DN19726_c0_g1_i1.p1  ORF type:complete len:494 (+),score=70.23 TRINITY_DN19726_c0_g1_i1:100-1581(+)
MLTTALLRRVQPKPRQYCGKTLAFGVTYFAYGIATAARLPYGIAKSSLSPDKPSSSNPGWMPFSGSGGQELLGILDSLYMLGYAGAMPVMGRIADQTNAALFLAIGLLAVAVLLILIGLAHAWQIHSFVYFAGLSFLGGCAQSIAYPCVIAVISRWFGKSNIGFLLGLWSSCTPIGTIFGKFAATGALQSGSWPAAFIVPGITTGIAAAVVAFTLVPDTKLVSLARAGENGEMEPQNESAREINPESQTPAAEEEEEDVVPIDKILRIPGLVAYSAATFFSKFSYYAFVFWLPKYLSQGLNYSDAKAGNMSTFFDWGGFCGGIIGGVVMDRMQVRGPVLLFLQFLAVPLLFIYQLLGAHFHLSDFENGAALFILGLAITTPYSLITSVMSTHLGRDPSLHGNSRASGTVTAILDGTGSFGAVVQGVMVGWVSDHFGWGSVFYVLMLFSGLSGCCLLRPSLAEMRDKKQRRVQHNTSSSTVTSLQPLTEDSSSR